MSEIVDPFSGAALTEGEDPSSTVIGPAKASPSVSADKTGTPASELIAELEPVPESVNQRGDMRADSTQGGKTATQGRAKGADSSRREGAPHRSEAGQNRAPSPVTARKQCPRWMYHRKDEYCKECGS